MMKVTVALEARYFVTPDGNAWTSGGMDYAFWKRYLGVFDQVRIAARAVAAEQRSSAWLPVTGEGVSLFPIPNYHGPLKYLMRYRAVHKAVLDAIPASGAVILRVPSEIGNCMERSLRRRSRPFAVEVVGDPREVFAPGVVEHPFRPLFRWHFSKRLRRQCEEAIGVAYVTERTLQRAYPARSMVGVSDVQIEDDNVLACPFLSSYSSITLEEDAFAVPQERDRKRTLELVTVGSLAQRYKGIDTLIEAVHICVRAGLNVRLTVVGDGKYRSSLEKMAKKLCLDSRIVFRGQLPAGQSVRDVLDRSDLFVLPSRTEGLPRAMIEAMARGLPCIGSAVGGIPELLDPEDLVPPDNGPALAAKIREVFSKPGAILLRSQRNLNTARQYTNQILAPRRELFYSRVLNATRLWEESRT